MVQVFCGQRKQQISHFLEENKCQVSGWTWSRWNPKAGAILGGEAQGQAGQGGTVQGRQGAQGNDGHF